MKTSAPKNRAKKGSGGMEYKRKTISDPIDLKKAVKVIQAGNHVKIMALDHRSMGPKIKKISKDRYIELSTGEVKDFQHIKNRAQNKRTVAQSLEKLQEYINTNVNAENLQKVRWVTLTYVENMTDPKRLYDDHKKMIRQLHKEYGNFEYIAAAEPQERGAWHLHELMIFPEKAPFIPNKKLAAIWDQGYVMINKLDNIDNVGVYLTCYLTDVEYKPDLIQTGSEIIQEKEVLDKQGNKTKKKYIKGARLHMYPSGFNIYRISKGISPPITQHMKYQEIKNQISGATLTWSQTVILTDVEKNFENRIIKEHYNTAKKQKE